MAMVTAMATNVTSSNSTNEDRMGYLGRSRALAKLHIVWILPVILMCFGTCACAWFWASTQGVADAERKDLRNKNPGMSVQDLVDDDGRDGA